MEFELDDFGDWLGHGVWNGGRCLCCDEGVCDVGLAGDVAAERGEVAGKRERKCSRRREGNR